MMSEGEEPPAVRLSKALTIFDGYVNSVVLAVEISASRWFLTRSVGKSGIQNTSQFFYNDRSFRKLARLEICINILLLDVDVMIFRKIRLSVVETVGR